MFTSSDVDGYHDYLPLIGKEGLGKWLDNALSEMIHRPVSVLYKSMFNDGIQNKCVVSSTWFIKQHLKYLATPLAPDNMSVLVFSEVKNKLWIRTWTLLPSCPVYWSPHGYFMVIIYTLVHICAHTHTAVMVHWAVYEDSTIRSSTLLWRIPAVNGYKCKKGTLMGSLDTTLWLLTQRIKEITCTFYLPVCLLCEMCHSQSILACICVTKTNLHRP